MKRFFNKIFIILCLLSFISSPIAAYEQDSFIIIKVAVSNTLINPAVVALYQKDTLYLPFEYLIKDLALALNYEVKTQKINGWLEDESKKVSIDFKANFGQVGKRMFSVSLQDFIYYEEELFLSLDIIDKLLLTYSEFDFNNQSLQIQTSGNLPFEKNLSRKQKRDKFDLTTQERQKRQEEELNKEIFRQEDFFQYPFIDLSARYSFYNNEGEGTKSNFGYSLNASFLTGGFDSNAYLYNSTDTEPPVLALKTGKIDESGNIFGLFKQLEMGDIYSFSSAENQGAQSGWGIKMSTDSAFNAEGKTYNIRSELPLGWEVELYRNGEMLGYQNNSAYGFFEFTDIPLLLGKNVFKFVFYGPQGQIKEKYDILFFNGNILDKGKTRVKLDYVNKNRYLVEFRDKPRGSSLGHQALAEWGYGITDNLTLNLSAIVDSLEIPAPYPPGSLMRQDKTFASADISLFAGGIYSSLNTIADFKENAFTFGYYGQTSLLDWDIILENIYFGQAITSRNIVNNTYVKNSTNFRLNKTLDLWFLGLFPVSYFLSYFSTVGAQNQTEHYASLSRSFPYNFYLNFTYQNSYWLSTNRAEYLGLNLNKIYGPYVFRGNILYDLNYDNMQDIEFSAYRNLTQRLKAGAKYSYVARSLQDSKYESLYSLNLNWLTKGGFISFEVGTSNRHNSYAFIGYNLSLLPDKRNNKVYTSPSRIQGTSAISALAFMDDNLNGIYDEGETVLPDSDFDVKPKVNYFDSIQKSNSGSTVLTHLPAYKPIEISLNINNIHDTLSLLDTSGEKTLMLRPAQIVYIDFPVVGTGDIEGTVFIKNLESRRETRGIILKLYNADTKEFLDSKISEFDGYYLFQKLPMGNYEIRIDEAQSQELALFQESEIKVNLNRFEQLEIKDIILNTLAIEQEGVFKEKLESKAVKVISKQFKTTASKKQIKNIEKDKEENKKIKVLYDDTTISSLLAVCFDLFKQYSKYQIENLKNRFKKDRKRN